MMMTSRALLLLVVAACSSPDSAPSIEKARPPWAPMTGGTTIELYGKNFDPVVNRVFVGGREAPVVRTLDREHLEIVVPPSEQPGDAEVVVVTPRDNLIATGVFRYSEPPTIESVTPARVVLTAPPPTISIHGTGFADEEAGTPTVVVDGTPIAEVTVRSDSVITFEAPSGVAFSRAQIEVINQRGAAATRGFTYALTDRPGLLIFNLGTESFATFYEPVEQVATTIPFVGSNRPCIYGVIGGGTGTYFGSDACSLGAWGFGRIDLASQRVVDGIANGKLYTTIARHRGILYAIEYPSNRFGVLSATGDQFTQVGSVTVPTFDAGLASDDTTMWIVSRIGNAPSIQTIDPETGVLGISTPLVPWTSISDLRWFSGTIYGTTTDGSLVTIDPTTGSVVTVAFVGSTHALDVFE